MKIPKMKEGIREKVEKLKDGKSIDRESEEKLKNEEPVVHFFPFFNFSKFPLLLGDHVFSQGSSFFNFFTCSRIPCFLLGFPIFQLFHFFLDSRSPLNIPHFFSLFPKSLRLLGILIF